MSQRRKVRADAARLLGCNYSRRLAAAYPALLDAEPLLTGRVVLHVVRGHLATAERPGAASLRICLCPWLPDALSART